MNRTWVYIVAGAAMVAGGLALLSQIQAGEKRSEDPIAEAQKMLSRAQTKVSEIEAGIRSAQKYTPQAA